MDGDRSDNTLDRLDSEVLPGTCGPEPGTGEEHREAMDARFLMFGVEGALVIRRGLSEPGDDGVGERP